MIEFLAATAVGSIELFMKTVEANTEKRIEAGQDPATAFEGSARDVFAAIKALADKRKADQLALSPPGEAIDGRLTLPLLRLVRAQTRALQIKDRNLLEGVDKNVVYIVRDDAGAVLYVGSTRNSPRSRLIAHVTSPSGSRLGAYVRQNRPRSNDWPVELIAHADYPTAAAKEIELIRELNPRFCIRHQQPENAECPQPAKRKYSSKNAKTASSSTAAA